MGAVKSMFASSEQANIHNAEIKNNTFFIAVVFNLLIKQLINRSQYTNKSFTNFFPKQAFNFFYTLAKSHVDIQWFAEAKSLPPSVNFHTIQLSSPYYTRCGLILYSLSLHTIRNYSSSFTTVARIMRMSSMGRSYSSVFFI